MQISFGIIIKFVQLDIHKFFPTEFEKGLPLVHLSIQLPLLSDKGQNL